jgi:hypothetical protein
MLSSKGDSARQWVGSIRYIVLSFPCSVLVATFCMATGMVCFQDVSLIHTCVESAHGVEGGAPGQHT